MINEPTQEQIEQIGAVLASGRKIDAIKIYREATGTDLKTAKTFIDALIPKLREQDPEKYARLATQGTGCASMILICFGLAAGGFVWVATCLA